MTNIVILCLDGTVIPFLESDHVYTRMTERHYRKLIPGFRDMTAKAQERHMRKWMRSNATTVRRAESTLYLPNTHKRLNGNRPTQEDYRSGASAFLGITELFQSRKSCYLLICYAASGPPHSMTRNRPSMPPSASTAVVRNWRSASGLWWTAP